MITVYLENFMRLNFCELPAKLKFLVFIFMNGDLTIYISYIANVFVLIGIHRRWRHRSGLQAVCVDIMYIKRYGRDSWKHCYAAGRHLA